MTSTPELDRKLNGAENPKSNASGEEDPCIEESKHDGERLGFRARTEKKLREKSGLSQKGLLIAGIVLLVLLLLLITVVALAAAWPRTPHHLQFPVCDTAACLRAAAQIQDGLNTSADPCTDIWNWSCGGWLKNNPLPRDRSLWNIRQQLKYEEAGRVRDLIATLPLPVHTGTLEWKLKHLYESCMEVDNVDADGIRPLKRIITELGGWHILRDWSITSWDYRRVLERLHAEYGATPFFKITVEPNPRNPSKNSIRISPSGLGLPGRSFYYADVDDKIISAYMRLLKDIVSKMDATSSEAIKFSKDIFYYEKRIAEITPDPQFLEDPVNTYNSVSVSELTLTAASLPLRDILVSMFPNAGITDETEVLVSSHDYLTAISGIVSSTDRSALNNYVIWCLVREYLPYLPTEYTAELQQYNSQLTGIQVSLERWEICANMIQRIMGLAVQSMLENQNPISESTTGVVKSVFENIRKAAVKHISDSNYPSEYYKHLTQKTSSLSLQVGLPKNMTTNTYLKNYYGRLYVQKSNLFQNMLHGFIFLRGEMQQQYLEPHLDYRLIPFLTSNSFKVGYSGPMNTIIVPRTLLNPPYFDRKFARSIIYGRLGLDISDAVVSSILPFKSSWTKDKGLLSSFHFVVNHSIQATIKPRTCLSKFVIEENYAAKDVAEISSLSMLKHLTALRLSETALNIALENVEHVHQPTLEKFEDAALFYISYSQTLCSQYSEQEELLENFINFKLNDHKILLVSWRQISNFPNALQCKPDVSVQCSDIL